MTNLKIILKIFLNFVDFFRTYTFYIYKIAKNIIIYKYKNFIFKVF